MIRKEEIIEIAGRVGLTPQVVEKDYALGWVLAAINHHPALTNWVFKGGTCLKKTYFETYRFSEDLDFTVISPSEIYEPNELKSTFQEVATWIEDGSGIEIPINLIEFEVFPNPRGTVSVQGKIGYRGPVRPDVREAQLPKIKVDVTIDEPVVLPPQIRNFDHAYSDIQKQQMQIKCYAYEEIFAEKIRALVQRLRPRDLYDVIHLFRRTDLNPNQTVVREVLEKKCQIKGIPFPSIDTVVTHSNRSFLESEWETMLSHQVSTLPPFEQFLAELPQVFSWISGTERKKPTTLTLEQDEMVQFESSTLIESTGLTYLEKIQFSAANRLIIKLKYQGTYRNIEPYSLARSSDGHLLLRAIKVESGEPRSYRFDRFEHIEILKTPFLPRYEVEITSSGKLPIHQLMRTSEKNIKYSNKITGSTTYIFKCSQCGKIFRRKSFDGKMREHKDKNGHACFGFLQYFKTET